MGLQSILSKYPYADVRIEHGQELILKISDNETRTTAGEYAVTSARVLVNGSWGFASSNDPNVDTGMLVERAAALAKLEKAGVSVAKCKGVKARITAKHGKNSAKNDNDEKIKQIADCAKEISGEHITNKTIAYRDWFVEKEFYNSEGSEIIQQANKAYFSCTAIAKDGPLIQRGYETDSSIEGFEKIKIHETARIAAEKAERSLTAVTPPKGRFTVVLDPEMTGVFCHEALGHACEADSVIERESILRGKIGKRIGSNLVTIVDDPTYKAFGYYAYDDEGIEAKKAVLLKDGKLCEYMNSRETAKKLKIRLNGHCRAQNAESVPIVRMSNTFMLPGKSKLDELFDIKQGIYMKGMAGGSVDIFSGSFMFKAEEAYEITNGEQGKLLRDVALSGSILETLRGVELVGNDFETSGGICGKFGQSAPVSDGGPHIRVNDMKVG